MSEEVIGLGPAIFSLPEGDPRKIVEMRMFGGKLVLHFSDDTIAVITPNGEVIFDEGGGR